MSYGVCARACVLMYQEFKDMLEEARQAEVTKNECAAMGWAMFLEMARTDEALHVGTPGEAAS